MPAEVLAVCPLVSINIYPVFPDTTVARGERCKEKRVTFTLNMSI